MAQRDYYERYWTDEGFNPRRDRVPDHLRAIFQRHVAATDDCLDLGCGDGGTSGTFLSSHARSYLGVDISAHAVALATRRGLQAQVIDDPAHLPVPDNSFDVVVCIEVLEHIFEPQLTATEAARVLRPGGRFIVTVPNAAYWRDRLDSLLGVWQPGGDDLGRSEPWRSPHIRFFQRASLERMLERSGFTSVTIEGVPGPVLGRVPLLRALNRQVGPVARALANARPTVFAPGLAAIAGI